MEQSDAEVASYLKVVFWIHYLNWLVLNSFECVKPEVIMNHIIAPALTLSNASNLPVSDLISDNLSQIGGKVSADFGSLKAKSLDRILPCLTLRQESITAWSPPKTFLEDAKSLLES